MKLFWAFSSFEIGGAQRRFANLTQALGSGFTHIVAAMDGRYEAESLLCKTINYQRCDVPVSKGGLISRKNVQHFSKVLLEEKPDLLLTTNWGSIEWRLANRKSKIPHLHCEDGFGPDEAMGSRNIKRDLARRILFTKLATGHDRFAFMAPSSGLLKIFYDDWGVPDQRLHLIPNGIDIYHFTASQESEKKQTVPVIGSVGALRPEKRFDRLIRIFSSIKKEHAVSLLLIGDGADRAMLEGLVDELGVGDSVTFTGAMSDVRGALAQIDIYMITSDTEQMPISLVEAMAAGKPVVGTDVGDVKRMVASSNAAFIHPSQQEEAMKVSLLELINDPSCAKLIGSENAEKAAKDYSVETMAQHYRKIFDQLTC